MDFELFISEVEKRPAIWDPRDPKHCNRDFTAKCWAEVAEIMQSEGLYFKIFKFSEGRNWVGVYF